jgi:hypothetical protein
VVGVETVSVFAAVEPPDPPHAVMANTTTAMRLSKP